MTTYLGLTLLDVEPHREEQEFASTLALRSVDAGAGKRWEDRFQSAPREAAPFRWRCTSRTEAQTARDFVAGCQGQLVPFWVPTWEADLNLAVANPGANATLTVETVGYTRYQFPAETFGRRYLAIILPNRTILPRKITAAVDNGDGTETLTLDSAPGTALSVGRGGPLLSWLRYARLGSDEIMERWSSARVADFELPILEVPAEAPTF